MRLLPPNTTPLERAIEDASERITNVPVPISDLWNPQTCPARLLPWLAWALSIDLWNSEWDEATKRDAIASAIADQRRKGTPLSIREALDRTDPAIEVTEWFQDTDNLDPYCFRLDLPNSTLSSVEYDEELIARILRDIDAVKPLRAQTKIVFKVASQAHVGLVSSILFATFERHSGTVDAVAALDPIWNSYLQADGGDPFQLDNGEFLEAA